MRNLKKILALVLALVMSFSVMTVSSAAFKDADKIAADYSESVEVLNAIGVFRGDENGKFNPQKSITRAEVAAIIYRITTGDVEDTQVEFYSDLNVFTDVPANEWFAGYVNYCAAAGYIKGRSAEIFDPSANVTGYEALTMILRAVGYDKTGEFTGNYYYVSVAEKAQALQITKTLKNVLLGAPASREVVAEILFRTIAYVDQVDYTLAFGYSEIDGMTLGWENFGLYYAGALDRDDWGVPYAIGWCCNWYDDLVDQNGILTMSQCEMVYESFEAAYECDIAEELGIETEYDISRVTENATVIYDLAEDKDVKSCGEFDGTITATSTKKAVGAQGRWTRIFVVGYDAYGYPVFEMVMMDQFLGEVIDVTEITYDRNNHVIDPARVYIEIYDDSEEGTTVVMWPNYEGDWDYEIGDFVLLHHEATKDGEIVPEDEDEEFVPVYENLGAPEALVGKQTAFVINSNSHIVNDEEYEDAYRLYRDDAGRETTEHVWLFDQYENLIGIVEKAVVDNTQYGVITAIKWIDDYTSFNNSYALAQILYMDGSSSTLKVDYINDVLLTGIEGGKNTNTYASGEVSSTPNYNGEFLYHTLYAITTDAKGYVHLDNTILLKDAYTNTYASALGDSGFYATKNTKFLVLTDDGFAMYNGIKEVPSYVKGYGTYWAVDAKGTDEVANDGAKDFFAEYVYICMPEVAGEEAETYNGLFYADITDKLTVKHYVKSNNVVLWEIRGGMVDGEETIIVTPYEALKDLLTGASKGRLMYVTFDKDTGYALSADYVTENYYYSYLPKYIDGLYCNAIYEGSAANAKVIDGVLYVNGNAYDIDDAEVISEKRTNLADIVKFAKETGKLHEDAYLYIVYTRGNNGVDPRLNATALTIYVSTVPGYDFYDVMDKYIDAVDAAQAELDAAIAALETATAAAAEEEVSIEDLIKAVEAAKAKLQAAIDALTSIINSVKDAAKVDESLDYNLSAAYAERTDAYNSINDATEIVIETEVSIEIGAIEEAISVDVVYTVEDDTAVLKSKIRTAIRNEVLELDNIAALIDEGFKVTIGTPADAEYELAEGTFTGTFAIIVYDDYTESLIEIEVEVNVTFDDGEAAE